MKPLPCVCLCSQYIKKIKQLEKKLEKGNNECFHCQNKYKSYR